MFRDTLRKNGHSGVTDKEMQELLNTFPAEKRASRKAAGIRPKKSRGWILTGRTKGSSCPRPRVKTDPSRDALLTEFGKATLTDRYLMPGNLPGFVCALLLITGMMKTMPSAYMTIFRNCGSCPPHRFCLMAVRIAACRFPVFERSQ